MTLFYGSSMALFYVGSMTLFYGSSMALFYGDICVKLTKHVSAVLSNQ